MGRREGIWLPSGEKGVGGNRVRQLTSPVWLQKGHPESSTLGASITLLMGGTPLILLFSKDSTNCGFKGSCHQSVLLGISIFSLGRCQTTAVTLTASKLLYQQSESGSLISIT